MTFEPSSQQNNSATVLNDSVGCWHTFQRRKQLWFHDVSRWPTRSTSSNRTSQAATNDDGLARWKARHPGNLQSCKRKNPGASNPEVSPTFAYSHWSFNVPIQAEIQSLEQVTASARPQCSCSGHYVKNKTKGLRKINKFDSFCWWCMNCSKMKCLFKYAQSKFEKSCYLVSKNYWDCSYIRNCT